MRLNLPVRLVVIASAIITIMAVSRAQIAGAEAAPRFKAVAFDYLVLFDPDSVIEAAERVFPTHGRELVSLWRNRQFEYSWLRSITDRYVDFSVVTDDALVYAAHALRLDLTPARRRQLLDAYLNLAPWPDTPATLTKLKTLGVRIIALANFSPRMLRENADHAGLTPFFDELVSTDLNRSYKPDPRAYALGPARLHLSRDEILFAAFGGWDAAGAKAFGFPTIWVNRSNQPLEELGVRPDRTSADLAGVLAFLSDEGARQP